MKTIRFFTNLVAESWTANNLNTGIGGTEEKLIELARELVKRGWGVTIYHNGEHGVFDGVNYVDHRDFKPYEFSDVFVSVKVKNLLNQTINADLKLDWSSDINEWQEWELNNVDKVLCISDWHRSCMKPKDHAKFVRSYIWADTKRHDQFKTDKELGSMLYCSSFDRGLEELLTKWSVVKEKLSLKKLYITYGWNFIDEVIKNNPQMLGWKQRMESLMHQEGVEFLGRQTYDDMCKLYWKCQYWCLPLNNPRSELFCINAIRSEYCGCVPVVRRVGALQETVNNFIDWDELMGEKVGVSKFDDKSLAENTKFAMNFSLEKGVDEWEKSILKV